MHPYVALFGSIKVGSNRLSMAELRAAFAAEGFGRAETVVASSNVLFDHPERPDEGLEEKLGLMLRHRFGFDSVALVRSRAAMAAAIAGNPFAAEGDEEFVHTLFLDGPVDADDFARLEAARTGADRLAAGDRALHIDYVAGGADSRQVSTFIERRLGRKGTARNVRSMMRILAKMEEN